MGLSGHSTLSVSSVILIFVDIDVLIDVPRFRVRFIAFRFFAVGFRKLRVHSQRRRKASNNGSDPVTAE